MRSFPRTTHYARCSRRALALLTTLTRSAGLHSASSIHMPAHSFCSLPGKWVEIHSHSNRFTLFIRLTGMVAIDDLTTNTPSEGEFLVKDDRVLNLPLGRSLRSFTRTAHSAHFAHSLVGQLKFLNMCSRCYRVPREQTRFGRSLETRPFYRLALHCHRR